MSDHLSREQLKRNELGEAVEASIHYAEDHLRTILIGVGALAAVALVGWGVFAWSASRRTAANDLLTRALKVAGAPVEAAARPDDPVSPSFASAGWSLKRRWPYHASVMKMLLATSRRMVHKLRMVRRSRCEVPGRCGAGRPMGMRSANHGLLIGM